MKNGEAELGISILEQFRGNGRAEIAMQFAINYCKEKKCNKIFMSCLRENRKMQHLAKKLGLSVVLDADEAYSELILKEISDDKIIFTDKNFLTLEN